MLERVRRLDVTTPGPPLILLIVITGLSPFAMNAIVPLIPALAQGFGKSFVVVQLALTVYLAALAISQPIIGPLSDRFGRRPLMLIGLVLFIAGSFICAGAPDIGTLLFGRTIQAVGGAAGFVLTRVILFDIYGRDRAASMIGYVTMAMVLSPMLAPVVSGLMLDSVGWRPLFWMLGGVSSLVLVATWMQLGETREPQPSARNSENSGATEGVLGNFIAILRVPVFWAYAGVMAFSSAIFFAFLGGASFIIIDVMGLPASHYGLYFISVSISYMTGNYISGKYSTKVGADRMMYYGNLLALVGVLTNWPLAGFNHPAAIFIPMGFVALSNGLVLPNASATLMNLRPNLAGSASGIGGALQIGVGALMTVVVAKLLQTTVFAMAGMMTFAALAAFVSLVIATRLNRRSSA